MPRIVSDQRGVAALEFALVGLPFFLLLIGIFDLGRYAITASSLDTLASMSARQVVINCFSGKVISRQSPATCTNDPYTAAQKQAIAPFLYNGGLTPTVAIAAGAATLTVTVSQPAFTMILPIWGASLNAPSQSAAIPF